MNALPSETKLRIEYYYQRAKNTVPWANTFAMVDLKEYFASAVSLYICFYY
jgi:hypothetical protein